jgi:hypothetical protein
MGDKCNKARKMPGVFGRFLWLSEHFFDPLKFSEDQEQKNQNSNWQPNINQGAAQGGENNN